MIIDLDFGREFDTLVSELEPLSKDGKGPAIISSRFIAFQELHDRALEDGFTLRDLPLSKLHSRYARAGLSDFH